MSLSATAEAARTLRRTFQTSHRSQAAQDEWDVACTAWEGTRQRLYERELHEGRVVIMLGELCDAVHAMSGAPTMHSQAKAEAALFAKVAEIEGAFGGR